jgi:hypothetical protein
MPRGREVLLLAVQILGCSGLGIVDSEWGELHVFEKRGKGSGMGTSQMIDILLAPHSSKLVLLLSRALVLASWSIRFDVAV